MGPLTQHQRRRRREPLIRTTIPTRRTLIERQPPIRLLRNRPLTPIRLRQRILPRPKRRRLQPQLKRHITSQPRHITHTHTVITIKPNRRPQQPTAPDAYRPSLAEAGVPTYVPGLINGSSDVSLTAVGPAASSKRQYDNRLVTQHQHPHTTPDTNPGVMRSNLRLRQRLAIHRHLINIPHIPIHIPITNQQRQRRIRRSHRHRSLRIQHPIDIPRQHPRRRITRHHHMGPLTQLQRRRRREPLIHTTIPTRRTLIERQPPRRLLRNRPLTPIRLRQRILTRPKRPRPQPQLKRHITRQPRHITHTHTVITIKPNRRPQQHRRRRRNSRPALAEARGTDIRARIDQRIKRRRINRRRTCCLIQTPIRQPARQPTPDPHTTPEHQPRRNAQQPETPSTPRHTPPPHQYSPHTHPHTHHQSTTATTNPTQPPTPQPANPTPH